MINELKSHQTCSTGKFFMHRNKTRIPMIIVTAQNSTEGFQQYNMKRKRKKMYKIRKRKNKTIVIHR